MTSMSVSGVSNTIVTGVSDGAGVSDVVAGVSNRTAVSIGPVSKTISMAISMTVGGVVGISLSISFSFRLSFGITLAIVMASMSVSGVSNTIVTGVSDGARVSDVVAGVSNG